MGTRFPVSRVFERFGGTDVPSRYKFKVTEYLIRLDVSEIISGMDGICQVKLF